MKFVQLHYFLSQNVGDKRYCVSTFPKVGVTPVPPEIRYLVWA